MIIPKNYKSENWSLKVKSGEKNENFEVEKKFNVANRSFQKFSFTIQNFSGSELRICLIQWVENKTD